MLFRESSLPLRFTSSSYRQQNARRPTALAAIVLLFSSKKTPPSARIQGVPPLIGLVLLPLSALAS